MEVSHEAHSEAIFESIILQAPWTVSQSWRLLIGVLHSAL